VKQSQDHAAAIQTLTELAAAGVRIAPDGANLRYWSPTTLSPELREEIVRDKAGLLTYLAVWNGKRAHTLAAEADALVESLGVPGTDPMIAAAADRCVAAGTRRDMAALRAACFAIEDRARQLAAATTTERSP
jgi:hypothetical protein